MISLDRLLGDIQRDSSSKIVSAKAASSTYFIKNQGQYDKKAGQEVALLVLLTHDCFDLHRYSKIEVTPGDTFSEYDDHRDYNDHWCDNYD